MVRDKTNITLSETDERRFTIYDVPQEETDGILKNLRKTFLLSSLPVAVVLIVLLVIMFGLVHVWYGRAMLFVVFVIVLFLEAMNINLYRTNVKVFRALCHYIKVSMVEKLPVETENIMNKNTRRNETYSFYPVKAKDTKKSNYTSVVYLEKEEYDNFAVGQEKKLYVSLSKDAKK